MVQPEPITFRRQVVGLLVPHEAARALERTDRRQDSRADLPVLPQIERPRGSIDQALAVASNAQALAEATAELRGDYMANSSRQGKISKRGCVEELAARVANASLIYPLTLLIIEGVAACLKAANSKSGMAYLSELRQGHVEHGGEIPPWMGLVFSRCKASLARGAGPRAKAPEMLGSGLRDRLDPIFADRDSDALANPVAAG